MGQKGEMGMKTKLFAIVIMGLALVNSACSVSTVGSDEVDPKMVYQSYGVHYSEDSNETDMDAQFRVKNFYGDTIELLYPSYVTVNKTSMNHYGFLGSRYDRKFGGFVQDVEFIYTDIDGDSSIHQTKLFPVKLKTYESSFRLGSAYRVTAEAENMRKDERYEASLCQYSENGSVCASASSNGSTIDIPISELARLTPGVGAELAISRTWSVSSSSAKNKGATVRTSYTARKVVVQVLK